MIFDFYENIQINSNITQLENQETERKNRQREKLNSFPFISTDTNRIC